jgi:prepilin-type N-terminal cleavage/methylation domain-containing protein
MKTRPHPSVRGYTLIEVMVAIALFGLVVIAIYSSWMAVVRASRTGLQVAAEAQRSRIAMRVIETALTSARMFEANGWYYGFEADSGSSGMLSFVARLPKFFPRGGRFGDFNVRRVTFSVEAGSESGKQLVLRQRPLLMEFDEDEKNYPLVLAHNVKELRFEFWDMRKGWIDEWKTTNQLPKMVKISLQLGQGGSYSSSSSQTEEIVRIVGLPSSGVQQIWQMPNLPPVPGTRPGFPPGTPPGPGGLPVPGGPPGSGVPPGGFRPLDRSR